jgi:hypothetical protein
MTNPTFCRNALAAGKSTGYLGLPDREIKGLAGHF